MDNTHQQANAIEAAPNLQLRFLIFDFRKEVFRCQKLADTPLFKRQVKLAKPSSHGLEVIIRAFSPSLLQLAALKQVALDLCPVKPHPGVDVLEFPVPIRISVFEL